MIPPAGGKAQATTFGVHAEGEAHHWMILNQDGPTSGGTCKVCGESRDFNNGYKWSPYSQRGGPKPPPVVEPTAPTP